MTPVKVGLLGLGTVGSGTVSVLRRNADEITRRAGRAIEIVCATARDLHKPRACDLAGIQLCDDPIAVVDDPSIDIVAELIGGEGLAKELVLRAIRNGKHVVTANKMLIALHGNEVFREASAHKVMVAFEAAVAGGIPIIKAIREGLSGNRVEWLAGIINGTSNFILSAMREQGRDFDDVLAEAQARGYAEADPTFDIAGVDAAHKLTILASIAFGIPLQFGKAYIEGIQTISAVDVTYAEALGYRIKLLGIARRSGDGIELRVHPALIPQARLLANVNGVMNAVVVKGDAVGPTLFYGAGAGAEPTASAVVADLIDVVRALTSDPENRVPHLAFQPDALADIPVLPIEAVCAPYYLRVAAEDKPGVLADIARILANQSISIEALIQKEPPAGEHNVPVIMLTQKVAERQIDEAIRQIEALTTTHGSVKRIRVETLA